MQEYTEATTDELLANYSEIESYSINENGSVYVILGDSSLLSRGFTSAMAEKGCEIVAVDTATNRVIFEPK